MGIFGSAYQSYRNFKNGRNPDGSSKISEEDLIKYTGKDRVGLDKFAANTAGVAGNQNAGSIIAGGNHGAYNGMYTTFDGHKIPKKG